MNEFGQYDSGDRVIYRPGIMDIHGSVETTYDMDFNKNFGNGAGTLRDYIIRLDEPIAGVSLKFCRGEMDLAPEDLNVTRPPESRLLQEVDRDFDAFFSAAATVPAPK